MLGLTFGLDALTRELLVYATFGGSILLLVIASWRLTPDRLARPAALAAIAGSALGANFIVTLAGGGASLDFERIAKSAIEGGSRRAVARAGTRQQGDGDVEVEEEETGAAGSAKGSDDGGVVGQVLGAVAGLAHAASAQPEVVSFKDCPHCPEMRVIAPGFFEMGAEGMRGTAAPARGLRVRIARRYAISAAVISKTEWQAFAAATGRIMPRCPDAGLLPGGEGPIACITQHDAVAYAEWLSRETARRYRLASEAEWEHAARAGSPRRFWSGLVAPQAVDGVVPANPNGLTGLHDRFGERVADCWSAGLSGDVADGRAFAQAGCRTNVVKDLDATGARASAAARLSLGHDVRHPSVGVRVVREME